MKKNIISEFKKYYIFYGPHLNSWRCQFKGSVFASSPAEALSLFIKKNYRRGFKLDNRGNFNPAGIVTVEIQNDTNCYFILPYKPNLKQRMTWVFSYLSYRFKKILQFIKTNFYEIKENIKYAFIKFDDPNYLIK